MSKQNVSMTTERSRVNVVIMFPCLCALMYLMIMADHSIVDAVASMHDQMIKYWRTVYESSAAAIIK